MNALIAVLAKNVLGGWITTGLGSPALFLGIGRIFTALGSGRSILEVMMSEDMAMVAAGMSAVLGRGPDLRKLFEA